MAPQGEAPLSFGGGLSHKVDHRVQRVDESRVAAEIDRSLQLARVCGASRHLFEAFAIDLCERYEHDPGRRARPLDHKLSKVADVDLRVARHVEDFALSTRRRHQQVQRLDHVINRCEGARLFTVPVDGEFDSTKSLAYEARHDHPLLPDLPPPNPVTHPTPHPPT